MNNDDKMRLKKAALVFADAHLGKKSAWIPNDVDSSVAATAGMVLALQSGLLTQAEYDIVVQLYNLYIYNQQQLEQTQDEKEIMAIRKDAQKKQNEIFAQAITPVAA